MTNKKPKKITFRRSLLTLKELKLLSYYLFAGVLLALILLIFGVPVWQTFSKFYGFIWMFLLPGLIIFRAVFKHKVFSSFYEEYGYPVLISWLMHSIIIVVISAGFKTAVTDLNLYGSSFVLAVIAAIIFYSRNK